MFNKNRLTYFYSLLFILISILVLRLIFLQVIRYEHYSLRSAKIRARIIPNIAPRGQIFDRNNKLLAASRPAFSAYILPVKLEDARKTSKIIANILKEDEEKIYQKILKNSKRAFEPILIKDYISFDAISLIEEKSHKLPSFVVGVRNIRSYNYDSLASHILGYIGEIDRKTLEQERWNGYKPGDIIGLDGIERYYEPYLRGINGGQQIEVDSFGRPVKVLGNINPIPGNNIVLTIDLDLQRLAEMLLKNRRGAIVVIQPKTGDILAMASGPSFRPGVFTSPISNKDWQDINKDHALHNRALNAYPPGSVFKIITAITALENNLAPTNNMYYCQGYMMIGRRRAGCWKAHGHISFFDGMVESCDIVFYNLGMDAGPDRIHKYGSLFGLGQLTGIDLPGESKGIMPNSAWKERVYKESWYPGDSMNLGLGQGFLESTPLQMAHMMSIVANRGIGYKPHLVKEIINNQGETVYRFNNQIINKVNLKESTWQFIEDTLIQVVEGAKGTGVASRVKDIKIAGKTGTSEDPPRKKPHAWFASYAPVDDPEIAVVVFLEGGGHGGAVAAPIAREIYKYYFKKGDIDETPF